MQLILVLRLHSFLFSNITHSWRTAKQEKAQHYGSKQHFVHIVAGLFFVRGAREASGVVLATTASI